MEKIVKKIVYGKLNFLFYFFWTTLKLKFVIKRPRYLYSYLLYIINHKIIKLKSSNYKIPNIDKKNYEIHKVNLSEDFLEKVSKVLSKPIKYDYDYKKTKKDSRYIYYQNFNYDYFKQVDIQADVERNYFINFLKENFGEKIKKLYGNHNFRVEKFEIYKTLNINNNETYNLNSNPHKDSVMPGALKIVTYLCDVDEYNGPFLVYDNESGSKLITGGKGTSIIFDPRNLLHAGSNTRNKERIAISFLIFPTLRNNLEVLDEKPFFSTNTINPFTKYT